MIIGMFVADHHLASVEALNIADGVALGTGGMDVDAAAPLLRSAGVSEDAIFRAKVRAWHDSKKEA